MTTLPDWLVERAALDEVAPASRDRVARADPRELADRVAALRDADADELAHHPPGPALAQIEARVAAARRRQRRRRWAWLSAATTAAAAVVLVAQFAPHAVVDAPRSDPADEVTRVKGAPRLVAFRQVGDQAERLTEDTVVRAGDVIQLRYKAGGQAYGVIASVDGAGVVTLHFPLREDAPTAIAPGTTALPHAYALDDAPGFERFFFITDDAPIDVAQTLAILRAFATHADAATAAPALAAGQHQWSLRLRKPDPTSTHESP